MAENLAQTQDARLFTHGPGAAIGPAARRLRVAYLAVGTVSALFPLHPQALARVGVCIGVALYVVSRCQTRSPVPPRGRISPLTGCCKRQSPRCRVCLQRYPDFLESPGVHPRKSPPRRSEPRGRNLSPNLERDIPSFNPQIPLCPDTAGGDRHCALAPPQA
jgi:hypothetical protein